MKVNKNKSPDAYIASLGGAAQAAGNQTQKERTRTQRNVQPQPDSLRMPCMCSTRCFVLGSCSKKNGDWLCVSTLTVQYAAFQILFLTGEHISQAPSPDQFLLWVLEAGIQEVHATAGWVL